MTALFTIWASGVFFSCSLLRPPAPPLVVHVPAGAVGGQIPVVWTLWWWSGTAVERRILPPHNADAPLRVVLPRAAPSAVGVVVARAAPVLAGDGTPESWSCAPLGGWGARRDLSLQPELGIPAEVILSAAEAGLAPELINLERLRQAVREECKDGPTLLDAERLREDLRALKLRRWSVRVRERPAVEVALPLDERGRPAWWSDQPGEGALPATVVGEWAYWSIPVAAGEVRHLWRSVGQKYELLTLTRGTDGHAAWRLVAISPPR